jgi:tRNA (cmo5U34)-methyltransferase
MYAEEFAPSFFFDIAASELTHTSTPIDNLWGAGGSVWIADLVSHGTGPVQSLMRERYGRYLCDSGGRSYKEKVLACIDREDSPRPVTNQMDLLRKVGFNHVELLHKNCCFATFGAIKAK